MSSTQISCSSPTLWNVFLSFRGIDTRLGFTSHLYDALHRNGIRTFMDDPELHSGELISSMLLDAIRNSKIYIFVLSENYASSSWCLDELVEILKCFREFGRSIIPIFYKIDPSVVRHQTGNFRTAFEIHEKVHLVGMDKLNKWRLALSQVADFSGHHTGETRSEADIINEVVDAVLREINPMTINVAKYPVGIDSLVADITPLLTSDSQGVHYIGIWGMGGVGKTTLAKALYNANFGSFEGSCFLANITEVFSQPNGPQGMQAQLIADVLKVKKPAIDSVDQGTELIRQRIQSKKVLVVADNLINQKQLDSLLLGSFACGSVIILTTRHQDLLARVGVKATYQYMLSELGDAHSRLLFNKHAFGDDNPSDTFVVLSKEVLHHAGGLPLALEIFGSSLRNQPEAEWRRFIGELKEVVNPDIRKKLIISFESLVGSTLKEMFLDIALLFVGHCREDVVPILGSCYKDVNANIDRLKSRCLIKISDYNKLSMHGLVRDMGCEIARQNSGKVELRKQNQDSGWEVIYNIRQFKEGRSIYDNMKAFIRYMISSNIGEVSCIFLTVALGIPGLIPVQLLWVIIVTDGPPVTALGFNPPDKYILTNPRNNKNYLNSPWILFRYLVIGLYVGIATVGVFIIWFTQDSFLGINLSKDGHTLVSYSQLANWNQCNSWGNFSASPFIAGSQVFVYDANPCDYFQTGKIKAITLSLSVMVSSEMLYSPNALSEDVSLLSMPPWVNPWLLTAMLVSLGLHLLILYVPLLAQIFGIVPLSLNEWLLVLAVAFPVILIGEVLKFVGRCTSVRSSPSRSSRKDKAELCHS